MFRLRSAPLLPLALLLTLPWQAGAQNTLVPEGYLQYGATIVPDRVILTFSGDPATRQSVTWRTDTSVPQALAQIAIASDSPGIQFLAEETLGQTTRMESENGLSHHHSVTFQNLQPATLYAYRVGGGETWSEWFQFRTADADFSPFSFLYFGDAQNAVRAHFSRTIRQAFRDLPYARLMVHAGDLVNLRAGVHDDEWAEWFAAGGWLHGMVPSIATPGNHEHIYGEDAAGNETQTLSPHWRTHFTFPENGPSQVDAETVYYVDYQGVRFISLNSLAALNSEASRMAQAAWLESVLQDNPNRWTVVTYHHPMFSVSLGRDNPDLRDAWKPIFDRYGVDLVLQGHDHTYGRGANVGEGTTALDKETGTVYVVSVAGPKMYFVTPEAEASMVRTGEDTQLYQLIHVEEDRIRFEAITVTGDLYDAFDIVRGQDGVNRIVDREADAIMERRCTRPDIPGYRDTRCWEGTDFGVLRRP